VKLALKICTLLLVAACGQRNSTSAKPDKPPTTTGSSGSQNVALTMMPSPPSDHELPTLPPAPALPAVPRGLPERPASAIAVTEAGVALGALLFWDSRLSNDGKSSCSTCHSAGLSFGNDSRATAADGRPNARRTPTLVNLAWQTDYAWDGRYNDLNAMLGAHIKGQLGNDAATALGRVADNLTYRAHFARAFGSVDASSDNVLNALAQYVSTLYSSPSTWDSIERTPQTAASVQAGYTLFTGLAGCATCHVPPLYTDNRFHRIGLIASPDEGRGKVDATQAGAFRTPSLRTLRGRSKFFHDASATSLDAAIDWHLDGGRGQNADPSIIDSALRKIVLTAEQRNALGAFVRALDGTTPAPTAPTLP
jgi:cytochrome c peroxidase